ncbi:hypothetical protein B0J14DRAFT_635891 [Halenospora varia]|nr:hypothetical protein B0J14DRAFT_635891 [Halenospora varia]
MASSQNPPGGNPPGQGVPPQTTPEATIETLRQQLRESQGRIEEARTQLTALGDELNQYHARERVNQSESVQLSSQINDIEPSDLLQQLNEAHVRIAQLEEQSSGLAELQTLRNQARVTPNRNRQIQDDLEHYENHNLALQEQVEADRKKIARAQTLQKKLDDMKGEVESNREAAGRLAAVETAYNTLQATHLSDQQTIQTLRRENYDLRQILDRERKEAEAEHEKQRKAAAQQISDLQEGLRKCHEHGETLRQQLMQHIREEFKPAEGGSNESREEDQQAEDGNQEEGDSSPDPWAIIEQRANAVRGGLRTPRRGSSAGSELRRAAEEVEGRRGSDWVRDAVQRHFAEMEGGNGDSGDEAGVQIKYLRDEVLQEALPGMAGMVEADEREILAQVIQGARQRQGGSSDSRNSHNDDNNEGDSNGSPPHGNNEAEMEDPEDPTGAINRLEEEIQELQRQLDECRQHRRENDAEIDRLRQENQRVQRQYDEANGALDDATQVIARYEIDLPGLLGQVENQNQTIQNLQELEHAQERDHNPAQDQQAPAGGSQPPAEATTLQAQLTQRDQTIEDQREQVSALREQNHILSQGEPPQQQPGGRRRSPSLLGDEPDIPASQPTAQASQARERGLLNQIRDLRANNENLQGQLQRHDDSLAAVTGNSVQAVAALREGEATTRAQAQAAQNRVRELEARVQELEGRIRNGAAQTGDDGLIDVQLLRDETQRIRDQMQKIEEMEAQIEQLQLFNQAGLRPQPQRQAGQQEQRDPTQNNPAQNQPNLRDDPEIQRLERLTINMDEEIRGLYGDMMRVNVRIPSASSPPPFPDLPANLSPGSRNLHRADRISTLERRLRRQMTTLGDFGSLLGQGRDAEVARLGTRVTELEVHARNLMAAVDNLAVERDELREEGERVEGDMDAARVQLGLARHEIDGLNEEHDGLQHLIMNAHEDLRQMEAQRDRAVGERDRLRADVERLEGGTAPLREEQDDLLGERERERARAYVDQLEVELASAREGVGELVGQLEELRGERGDVGQRDDEAPLPSRDGNAVVQGHGDGNVDHQPNQPQAQAPAPPPPAPQPIAPPAPVPATGVRRSARQRNPPERHDPAAYDKERPPKKKRKIARKKK